MAKKVKNARFIREFHYSDAAHLRREPLKPSGLYLLELRAHLTNSILPKRKLVINIDSQECEDGNPKPIKITHT